jgi:hypothetical protein
MKMIGFDGILSLPREPEECNEECEHFRKFGAEDRNARGSKPLTPSLTLRGLSLALESENSFLLFSSNRPQVLCRRSLGPNFPKCLAIEAPTKASREAAARAAGTGA